MLLDRAIESYGDATEWVKEPRPPVPEPHDVNHPGVGFFGFSELNRRVQFCVGV